MSGSGSRRGALETTTRITEDAVWRYYNCPDPFWSAKCKSCRGKIVFLGIPVEECLNCWKIEAWSPDMERLDSLIDGLAARGVDVVAKASRAPILVVKTGIPLEAYPPEEVDYLLILYARDIAERDALRREAEAVLSGQEERDAEGPVRTRGPILPIRRGCWKYDQTLGPWQTWYPPDRDHPPDLPIEP